MLENLDWKEILRNITTFATSETAKELLAEMKPLATQDQALQQMKEIEEAQLILSLGLRPHLKSLDLYHIWFDRLNKQAVLKPIEFRDVRSFCLEIIALDEALKEAPATAWGQKILSQLLDAKRPHSAIEQILTPEGEIRTDASEKLYKLYREKQDKEREIRLTLDKLVKAHEMEPLLQDKYVTNREGRWVLPIRSGMRYGLEGIIHDVSHTKQTVFMEPQAVVQVNNALRQVEVEITEEVERLLKELSQYLSDLCPEFQRARTYMIECDQRLAQAQFAKLVAATIPEFSRDTIHLRNIKHPLLCLDLPNEQIVPNTVTLNKDGTILVLSGPNAGGKTVLLKSVGLAAQMARCGLPICASSGSQVPFFTTVMTAVGDAQSVEQHLSTFASHLKMLTRALELKGFDHLVLIDEICGSTDPEEGSALARSFIEAFAKNKIFAVITSHLGPLKSGWENSGVLTGSMDFDEKSSQPTYQLIMGLYGRSLAIKTAKKVGVPDYVVDRALNLIGPEAKEREDRLSELEQQRIELQKTHAQFQKLANEARDVKHRYSELVEKFKAHRDEWMKKSVEQAEKKIQSVFEEMRRDQMKTKSVHDFKAMLPQIVKGPQKQAIESAEDFGRHYPPGSSVYVKTLNQDAVVQGTPNQKGEVPILSNSMRLFVHWTNLTTPKTAPNPTAQLARKSGIVSVSLQDQDREIDLRGQRVETALEVLESELDTAVRNKEERIKIIHGHGTEALKKAVRAYFARSVYVKKWKAGDPHSGGDGITWVELAD